MGETSSSFTMISFSNTFGLFSKVLGLVYYYYLFYFNIILYYFNYLIKL
jgi:hypothetical protein